MKCEMHRCCCFKTTKAASLASGIYTTITSVICIIYFALIETMSEDRFAYDIYINPEFSIISFVVMIIFLIFSPIFLYGVIKQKRLALIPWMVWMIIVIALECIGVILIIVLMIQFNAPVLLINLFMTLPFIGLNITCLIVVKTHYQILSAIPTPVDEESLNYSSLDS